MFLEKSYLSDVQEESKVAAFLYEGNAMRSSFEIHLFHIKTTGTASSSESASNKKNSMSFYHDLFNFACGLYLYGQLPILVASLNYVVL